MFDAANLASDAPNIRPARLAALFATAETAEAAPPPEPVADLDAVRDSGYKAGFDAGVRAAEGDLRPARSLLAVAADALRAACQIDVQALHAPFVALVTRLAEAVVAAELQLAPAIVGDLVAVALASITLAPDMVLRLHPDDAALLGTAGLPLQLVADPQVMRGSAMIEAAAFVIADSFEARLATVLETLP